LILEIIKQRREGKNENFTVLCGWFFYQYDYAKYEESDCGEQGSKD
jgi:hypothetical protein